MQFRYFTLDPDGPTYARIMEIEAQRKAGHAAIMAFIKKHRVSQMYGDNPLNYCFDFKTAAEADPKKWAKSNRPRGVYYFVPKRNTPEGKALRAELDELPSIPAHKEAVSVCGLDNVWSLSEGDRIYGSFFTYIHFDAKVAVLKVPWRETDPSDLAAYKRDKEAGIRGDTDLDHLLWEPPADLHEVKEWEALKLIDGLKVES